MRYPDHPMTALQTVRDVLLAPWHPSIPDFMKLWSYWNGKCRLTDCATGFCHLLERYALQCEIGKHEEESPLQHILNEIKKLPKEIHSDYRPRWNRILSTLISMIVRPSAEALDIGTAVGYSRILVAPNDRPGGRMTTIWNRSRTCRACSRISGVRESGKNHVEIIKTGDGFDDHSQQKKKYHVFSRML